MEFIESPPFTRYLSQYLDDEGYKALQNELARNPHAGDVMPGTGGFRKMRGLTRGAAKAAAVACGLSTTTSRKTIRSG
jgi:hypothetical protein